MKEFSSRQIRLGEIAKELNAKIEKGAQLLWKV